MIADHDGAHEGKGKPGCQRTERNTSVDAEQATILKEAVVAPRAFRLIA